MAIRARANRQLTHIVFHPLPCMDRAHPRIQDLAVHRMLALRPNLIPAHHTRGLHSPVATPLQEDLPRMTEQIIRSLRLSHTWVPTTIRHIRRSSTPTCWRSTIRILVIDSDVHIHHHLGISILSRMRRSLGYVCRKRHPGIRSLEPRRYKGCTPYVRNAPQILIFYTRPPENPEESRVYLHFYF